MLSPQKFQLLLHLDLSQCSDITFSILLHYLLQYMWRFFGPPVSPGSCGNMSADTNKYILFRSLSRSVKGRSTGVYYGGVIVRQDCGKFGHDNSLRDVIWSSSDVCSMYLVLNHDPCRRCSSYQKVIPWRLGDAYTALLRIEIPS